MNVPTHRAARIRRLTHKKRMVFFFLTGFPSHRRRPAPVHVSLYSTRVRNGSHIPHFLPTFHLADHKHSRTAHLRSTGVCRRQNLGTGKTHFRRAPQFHTVPIKTAAPEGAAVRLSTKSTASLKNASIFSKRCGLLRRTSSGQSPHRSPRPDGQVSLCSLAPPLPNGPASLGSIWVPIFPVLVRFKGRIVKMGTQHEPNGVGRVGRRRHKGADRLFAFWRKERGADFGATTIPLLD